MKKILFLCLTTLLFTACSNQELEDVFPANPEPEKTAKVSFNVSGFSAIVEDIKKSLLPEGFSCQYVIYKGNNVVKNNTLFVDNGKTISIDESLPVGSYKIAIVAMPQLGIAGSYNPDLFYKDYCKGYTYLLKANFPVNKNVYYELVEFNVVEGQNQTQNVVLKPKWTEINIDVTNADVCLLPEGTTHVQCLTNPYFYGFSIPTGIPERAYDDFADLDSTLPVTVEKFRQDKGYFGYPVSESKDEVIMKLVFLKKGTDNKTVVLGEQFIFEGPVLVGKRVTFTGKLEEKTTPPTSGTKGFSVTLKDLTDIGEIPFNQ